MLINQYIPRITNINDIISFWLNCSELDRLIALSGGQMPKGLDLRQRLNWLAEFSNVWDFRGRQSEVKDDKTGERARWHLEGNIIGGELEQAVQEAISKLGLKGFEIPQEKEFDYALVLGGARMSCLYRMRYAKVLQEEYDVKIGELFGLAGMRGVLDSERAATDTYAPSAATEFDLMYSAMCQIFPQAVLYDKQGKVFKNTNYAWKIEKYHSSVPISLFAAPSTEPEKRRTNTSDTFHFWLEKQKPGKAKKILLITSQIYVPYQQTEAVRVLGIPEEMYVETVGFPTEWSEGLPGLQNPVNYLQEIRSTVLAMERLVNFHR